MFRSVVLLCVVMALVEGQITPGKRCRAGDNDLPINAYVEGCTTPPCAAQQNGDVVVHLVFKAPHDILSMETLVTGYLITFPFPFPLEDAANTCNFLTNTECPISNGELVKYTLRMTIDERIPLITAPTEFRIVDENRNPITCIALQFTVLPPAGNGDYIPNQITEEKK